jgi:hypothetical protein
MCDGNNTVRGAISVITFIINLFHFVFCLTKTLCFFVKKSRFIHSFLSLDYI